MDSSMQELWNIITQKSCLTDQEAVNKVLLQSSGVFTNTLEHFNSPSPTSLAKIKTSASVKRKDLVIRLSNLLNVDELQTHEIFQHFMRLEFRGSSAQFQAAIKDPKKLHRFILKVLEFYYKERCYLLKCIYHVVVHWQIHVKFKDSFLNIMEKMVEKNFSSKLIARLKESFKQSPHDGMKCNEIAQGMLARQLLKEQVHITEILIMYQKCFEFTSEMFIGLATLFKRHHFGRSQANQRFLCKDSESTIKKFSCLSSLLLLQTIDLDGHDISPCNTSHSLLVNDTWKNIDELLYSWNDVQEQGPVLLGWMLLRHLCLPTNQQKLTSHFVGAAMRCQVFSYFDEVTKTLKSDDHLLHYIMSLLYTVLNLFLKIYSYNAITESKTLDRLMLTVLQVPSLSSLFLSNENGGLHLVLASYRELFPFSVCPYVKFLTSLCVDEATSDLVYVMFDHLSTYTEIFSSNKASELECIEKQLWRRTTERVLLQNKINPLKLPLGALGEVTVHKDFRIVRWNYDYSGWTYMYLLLSNLSTSHSAEDPLQLAECLIDFLSAVLKHNQRKVKILEPVITVVVKLMKKMCQLDAPPVQVLVSCLRCFCELVKHNPSLLWEELSSSQLLPSVISTQHRILESILLSEQSTNHYEFTRQYLDITLEFVRMQEPNRSDVSMTTNVKFALKKVFAKFQKWCYLIPIEKLQIGLKCLEIADIVLSVEECSSSLKGVTTECLLYDEEAASTLLAILSMGCDCLDGEYDELVHLVRSALSVFIKLLQGREMVTSLSPLEDSVKRYYVQHDTRQTSLTAMIASYLFYRQDPKICIFSVIALRAIASGFPMLLMAHFGENLDGVRNSFVNRLASCVDPVRLKIAILEFLMECVDRQPGLVESFVMLDKDGGFGRFSCLPPVLSLLSDTKQLDVLTVSVVAFLSAFWIRRYDKAMMALKKREKFWGMLLKHLKEAELNVTKQTIEYSTHVLNVVALETYSVEKEMFDKKLLTELQSYSDGKVYGRIAQLMVPSGEQLFSSQRELIRSWKVYLLAVNSFQPGTSGLTNDKITSSVFNHLLDVVLEWSKIGMKVAMDIVLELSILICILCDKWPLRERRKTLNVLTILIAELFEENHKNIVTLTVLYNIGSKILLTLDQGVQMPALTSTICCHCHAYSVAMETKNTKMAFNGCLTFLNNLSLYDSVPMLVSLQENCTIQTIQNQLQRADTELSLVENALMVLVNLSKTSQGALHLLSQNIGEFFCLNVNHIFNEQNDSMSNLRAMCVIVTTNMLKRLKHNFLPQAINFIGAHRELLLKSMRVMHEFGDELRVAEQTSILMYECMHYYSQVAFHLQQLYHEIKFGISHMCHVSVALLIRPRFLAEISEHTDEDNTVQLRARFLSCQSDSVQSVGLCSEEDPSNELLRERLFNIIAHCVSSMRLLSPDVVPTILDEELDMEEFTPLVSLNTNSPSLEPPITPSFGTLIAALNHCVKNVVGNVHSTPEKERADAINNEQKKVVWYIIENLLVVILSQASCYLRHTQVDERSKQFLKRELGSELNNFLYSVNRYRRAIPPSPMDKFVHAIRRSPNKMAASFVDENEVSVFRLVEIYTQQLLS